MKLRTSQIYLSIILFLFTSNVIATPPLLQKKINLEINNETVADVLKKIEQLTSVRFIYMAGLFDTERAITYSFNNMSLGSALEKLVLSKDVLLYIVDDKIIFYKKTDPPPGNNGISYSIAKLEDTPSKSQQIRKQNVYYDTIQVVVYERIPDVVKDTITIYKYDTIRVNNPSRTSKDVDKINADNRFTIFTNFGFMQQIISENNLSDEYFLLKESESKKGNFYTLGIKLNILNKKAFSLETGVLTQNRSWEASYDSEQILYDYSKIIGYTEKIEYKMEWVVEYFHKPYQPGYPDWHDDIDSMWRFDTTKIITKIPIFAKDTLNSKYSGKNQLQFIQIPLHINLHKPIGNRFIFNASLGISLDLLIASKGNSIKNTQRLTSLNTIYKDYGFSTQADVGIAYKITPKQSISLGLTGAISLSNLLEKTYIANKRQFCYGINLSYSILLNH
ncbi:MAG: hypothetical protein IPO21_08705 [Bacteroidales bacterium]|nr:hypothetical protein [Bacteroidales bacterium]